MRTTQKKFIVNVIWEQRGDMHIFWILLWPASRITYHPSTTLIYTQSDQIQNYLSNVDISMISDLASKYIGPRSR